MTQIAVKNQINAIKQATKQAIKTKESAIQFLVDAGIIDPPVAKYIPRTKKSLKKN